MQSNVFLRIVPVIVIVKNVDFQYMLKQVLG